MRNHKLSLFGSVLFVLVLLASTVFAGSALAPFAQQDVPLAPDYANKATWLAFPHDASKHPVDIFWVYPTVLSDSTHWLMDANSPDFVTIAQPTLLRQASVFSGQANLYAPMYRQMNMAGLGLTEAEQTAILKYGKEDVWRAFEYYLKHLNQGRPFIVAGHSQGSNVFLENAVKKWGTLGVEKQLVAAYLIGWSITEADLKKNSSLTMCESATQSNCFISYNTVAAGRQKVAPTIREGAIVTNPLTWKTTGEFAPASLNSGARFFMPDGSSELIPHFTSAQVAEYGLVVQPADPSFVAIDSKTFPKGVYHPFDYSLFYENIRQNVVDRIKAFTSQK